MLAKVAGLARALVIILAVVAGFVAIPNLNVNAVLVGLGLIAGTGYGDDTRTNVILTALVMPLASAALGMLPLVGVQLGAVAANVGIAAAAAAAASLSLRLLNLVKDDLAGLTKKG